MYSSMAGFHTGIDSLPVVYPVRQRNGGASMSDVVPSTNESVFRHHPTEHSKVTDSPGEFGTLKHISWCPLECCTSPYHWLNAQTSCDVSAQYVVSVPANNIQVINLAILRMRSVSRCSAS